MLVAIMRMLTLLKENNLYEEYSLLSKVESNRLLEAIAENKEHAQLSEENPSIEGQYFPKPYC